MSRSYPTKSNEIIENKNQTSCMHSSKIICTNLIFCTNSKTHSYTTITSIFNNVHKINILVYVTNMNNHKNKNKFKKNIDYTKRGIEDGIEENILVDK